MAQSIMNGSQLRLVFEAGLDQNGKMTYKSKTFSNVKATASPDALYSVAQAIVGLQGYVLDSIERNDKHLIVQ
jgi:Protein of unknown function (DUF1659)